MPANGVKGSFHNQLLVYCRENNLPEPAGNRLVVHKDGADLLVVGGAGESDITVWADLGKIADFRDEEAALLKMVEVSSQLNPLHGIFMGMDMPSERIMLRARFPLVGNDGTWNLAGSLAETAEQVVEIRTSLREESKR